MSIRSRLLNGVRAVLTERSFSERQIGKIIPKLDDNYLQEPKALAQIIDTWNVLMNSASEFTIQGKSRFDLDYMPPVAKPPINSTFAQINQEVNMTTILADVEPTLLLFDPPKLIARHNKVCSLNFTKNMGELWTILFHAPRGFYLQDWIDLTKKIYYIEHNLVDLLYDKKQQRDMQIHPLVKSAAIVEHDFDHIRTRYLFALRSGYKKLSHLYSVQTALDIPILRDLVETDDETFLSKFAPFCSLEEYTAFSNLIKKNDLDIEDSEVFEKLAELDGMTA